MMMMMMIDWYFQLVTDYCRHFKNAEGYNGQNVVVMITTTCLSVSVNNNIFADTGWSEPGSNDNIRVFPTPQIFRNVASASNAI